MNVPAVKVVGNELLNNKECMEDEMTEMSRQIKMGWERGFRLGLAGGALGMFILGLALKIAW